MSQQKFERVKVVGRGQFGIAYLVKDAAGRKLVLKEIQTGGMDDTEKKATFAEVDLLRSLDHINIVKYLAHFFKASNFVILMEFCGGGDLSVYIKAHAETPIAKKQILDWFVQLCTALYYIHKKRILHRDLKSQNVFLTKYNVVKLGDFGIAKVLDSTLKKAQTVVGTPYYMSPEVCQSQPYSHKSDLWSLGIVMYELCARKTPFSSANFVALVFKIVQEDPAPIPAEYGADMSELVDGLLTKDPEKRWGYREISKCAAFDSHTKSAEAGQSVGRKVNKEERRLRKLEKKRRSNEEHRRRLEKVRKEQFDRNRQARMRSEREFQTTNRDLRTKPPSSPHLINDSKKGKVLPPPSFQTIPEESSKTPKRDRFNSDAFIPRSMDVSGKSEFLLQFTFNEPLVVTASCFDRVEWDGEKDVVAPRKAYEDTKCGPVVHLDERKIKSTGRYDWHSDPNAFPEGKAADAVDAGEKTTKLYNTVGGEDDWEFDTDEDDDVTDSREETKALRQNIREAVKVMAAPIITTCTIPKPQRITIAKPRRIMRALPRLKTDLHRMKQVALEVLGKEKFDRLHTELLKKWASKEDLSHDKLVEMSKGDTTVLKHCENLIQIITIEQLMSKGSFDW